MNEDFSTCRALSRLLYLTDKFDGKEKMCQKIENNPLTKCVKGDRITCVKLNGGMAQLVERLVRIEEASGSNPLISTKTLKNRLKQAGLFFAETVCLTII